MDTPCESNLVSCSLEWEEQPCIHSHKSFRREEVTTFRCLFGKFRQVSSVTMPASLPLQLAKFPRKHTAPALTFFVGWGLKFPIQFVIITIIFKITCHIASREAKYAYFLPYFMLYNIFFECNRKKFY